MRLTALIAAAALTVLGTTIAAGPLAARDPVTPEQRIGRLEKQVRQVQKVVFPKGQPADTAGVDDTPAATQDSVNTLGTRLDAVEKQMADLVRASEENGNRLSTLEATVARQGAEADRRLRGIENGATPAAGGADAAPVTAVDEAASVTSEPARPLVSRPKVEGKGGATTATSGNFDPADPSEIAYQRGFDLWTAHKYDAAVAALRATAREYPTSRRASWARNLTGRAQLDKGDYRAAAETLLANYRADPKGERAPDSLFYLGQSLFKLGQPGQACKAYAELDSHYGKMRAPLRAMLPAALAEAGCH